MTGERPALQVSVGDLITFSARGGDLFSESVVGPSALEGIRGHQQLQEKKSAHWQTEVALTRTHDIQGWDVTVRGRVDALQREPELIVEEIKTTLVAPSYLPESVRALHRAQLTVYAWMVQAEVPGRALRMRQTWLNLSDDTEFSEEIPWDHDAVHARVLEWLGIYVEWWAAWHARQQMQRALAHSLRFPYDPPRPGQLELARQLYVHMKARESVLFEAPTGSGKTLSALFPAIKAFGEGESDQCLYLTVKGSAQSNARRAIAQFAANQCELDWLQLSAKDSACPCRSEHTETRMACEDIQGRCVRALGFFDRLPAARRDCLNLACLDKAAVEAVAEAHQLCPFELALQMLPWTPLVVADVNYVFDPLVHLPLFDKGADRRIALIDEVHNLPERGRQMFSAELQVDLLRTVLATSPKKGLTKTRRVAKRLLKALETEQSTGRLAQLCAECLSAWLEDSHDVLAPLPSSFPLAFQQWLKQVIRYAAIAALRSDRSHLDVMEKDDGVVRKLQCLDAGDFLARYFSCAASWTGFSATLRPMHFYQEALQLETAFCYGLPSVFPAENQLTLLCDFVDTRWQKRAQSLTQLVELIHSLCVSRPGKYLVFFPSYAYLQDCMACYREHYPDSVVLEQVAASDPEQRQQFLNAFMQGNAPVLGFAILGGVFGEGVDFEGDALHGVINIGTGMPQPGPLQKAQTELYEQRGRDAFDFVYRYPGFTRLLQSAGRVIRAPDERGIVVFVEPRLLQASYQALMPDHWTPIVCRSLAGLKHEIQRFWSRSA